MIIYFYGTTHAGASLLRQVVAVLFVASRNSLYEPIKRAPSLAANTSRNWASNRQPSVPWRCVLVNSVRLAGFSSFWFITAEPAPLRRQAASSAHHNINTPFHFKSNSGLTFDGTTQATSKVLRHGAPCPCRYDISLAKTITSAHDWFNRVADTKRPRAKSAGMMYF